MFGEKTVDDFITNFNSLISSGATSMIIDARNNGGGFLESAVDILSIFLQKNQVAVSTK
jgi:carboxyl-terminal processing protease